MCGSRCRDQPPISAVMCEVDGGIMEPARRLGLVSSGLRPENLGSFLDGRLHDDGSLACWDSHWSCCPAVWKARVCKPGLQQTWPRGSGSGDCLREITQGALKWAIWLTAFIVALDTVGVDVGALIAVFGIGGLAISFGAQPFIRDLISYVVFVFADNFRIGEEVLMDGKRGRIQTFEMGSVTLECGSDDEAPYLVYVPYSNIATVENYSRSPDEA